MRFGIRELIFVVLLLAIPVGAYLLVFAPHNEQIDAALRQIEAKQKKLASLRQATKSIEDLGAEIDKLREAITFFEDKLPPEREIDKILKEVWLIADKNTLQAKSVRTLVAKSCADYSEQPIKMELTGNFPAFYSFLLALENLPRITRIHQLRIQKDKLSIDNLKTDFTISIFFERGSTSKEGAADKAA